MINISIKGKYRPKNASVKVCKQAVQFAADKLISPKLQQNISIKLWFSEKETGDRGWFGYCDWIDENDRPRDFVIALSPGMRYHDLITTILHEMVHVEQYARGTLKEYVRSRGFVNWKGKMFKDTRSTETDSPWELEARAFEKKYYKKFKQHVKESV